jgi:uncharacterized protein YjbI with pentapeptide repeats
VDDRKRSGPGIKKDRGTFLAEDIIAALKALQILRETSKAPIRILLTGIDFDNINLAPPGGLDLSYFDFSYSTFNHSFLSGCKCRYTNFSFATFHSAAIWNADFAHANFKKANLSGAKFANVNFQGSNIEEASNLNVQVFAEPKGLTEHQRSLLP